MPKGRPDPQGGPGGPAGGWAPEGRIVMTLLLCPNYYPFSVCLIMGSTESVLPEVVDRLHRDFRPHHHHDLRRCLLVLHQPCSHGEGGCHDQADAEWIVIQGFRFSVKCIQ
jgi:hypothetical protein